MIGCIFLGFHRVNDYYVLSYELMMNVLDERGSGVGVLFWF